MATSSQALLSFSKYCLFQRVLPMLATVTCIIIAGCATVTGRLEPPYVSLAGIELKQVGVFEQRYDLTLRIQNPNGVALPIAGMNYALQLNGKSFAKGVNNKPVDIPAHGEALAQVEVTSNVVGLLDHIKRLGRKDEPSLDYKVEGSVSLAHRMIALPFRHEGSLKLRE